MAKRFDGPTGAAHRGALVHDCLRYSAGVAWPGLAA